jgi:predicted Zn-dependent protease
MYAAEPDNDIILDALNGMYEAQKDRAAQAALLDGHLAKYPNSYTALAGKGFMAMNNNDAPEAINWLKKATAAKPDNAVLFYYLGICYNSQAANTEDVAKRKELFGDAIAAFDKAKELDPNKQLVNWGYNRYQAYYALYGEDDARTKDAEMDK